MRIKALTACLVAVSAFSVALSATGGAATRAQLYKFQFGKLHADWLWPVNPFNDDKREPADHDVFWGKGCGTSPNKAIWRIRQQSDDLAAYTLLVDLVHVPKNPALITDNNYAGGDGNTFVKLSLLFPASAKRPVKMVAKKQGDIANFNMAPGQAAIKATKTARC